ncbi:Protein CBG25297 [Caenorhabditis briggsae]|uniref:Protein CBG25297 n=1 Tax=Caenorhabditis briggsae TaxID=6238 RepID=B6IIG7_CAEBR|nr:Protein CBG25297 [Caenorhabditis briggsae]CAR99697.1 Protein CBG25297 [Caenorhabditis briggsae]
MSFVSDKLHFRDAGTSNALASSTHTHCPDSILSIFNLVAVPPPSTSLTPQSLFYLLSFSSFRPLFPSTPFRRI